MRSRGPAALACAALLIASGCGGTEEPTSESAPAATTSVTAPLDQGSSSPEPTPPGSSPAEPEPPPSSASPASPASPAPPKPHRVRDVLAISVDGLNVQAIAGDAFGRLLDEGASTLNARTEVELTVTLPNHTGMLTGRRVDPGHGGHGVTWNEELPGRTVPGPDGDGVASVFDVVHAAGGTTALFAGKDKFATFERSWPRGIDEFEVDENAEALVDDTIADLTTQRRRLTFLHLELPDVAGHASGWLSPAYREAVAETDRLIGELLEAIDDSPRLSKRLVVVLTADHGGPPGEKQHDAADNPANYRIPFVVWGRGVKQADLYALNPDYPDPGDRQPSYDGAQPIRNGDLANLVTELLGLGPVPGSELDARQDLDWR